ncbi:MAG: lipoprotein signal peptidase [Marinilabiliales bacterium]|nr:lipoprotein signal peptidase [Marinilabiliales bacterium]
MNKKRLSILLILLVLVADQALKIYVKTHFRMGEEVVVFKNWFILHFIENNGMAFGIEFGNRFGKYLLSIFRLAAIFGLGWYLAKLWKKEVPTGLVLCFALILAGATGNLIDGAFYGMMFNGEAYEVAKLFPPEGGYSSFLQGRVVDIFYFPMIVTKYPSWFPFFGGQELIFFRHIFNIADAAVSTGVISILLFYRNQFSDKPSTVKTETEPNEPQE